MTPTHYDLPFDHLDVFHNIKFSPPSLDDQKEEKDTIKAFPALKGKPSRFDTAIVVVSHEALSTGLAGTRVGCICCIFKLPTKIWDSEFHDHISAPCQWPKEPLAHIEWYSPLAGAADPNHMMYEVSKPHP
ncbi:hypothetical protein JAAARDRAFT_198886 [Jaapia argillacea MUCL 33604]|uniref:Uncharacterized protein n=1 Tax=Jaapia argillacea MUCL 33604 TaxID=933084 RepID=A0A067PDA0_9AGAM|nr:hypothetical protein JAAARDRAFT_198886 [Jaapia argillacea MUCL 33604]